MNKKKKEEGIEEEEENKKSMVIIIIIVYRSDNHSLFNFCTPNIAHIFMSLNFHI